MEFQIILIFVIISFSQISFGSSSNSSDSSTTERPSTTAITTTIDVPLNCSTYSSCSSCTKQSKCFWCGPSNTCNSYHKLIPSGCSKNKWYLKQCVIPGYVLIIGIPSLAGLLLFICGCCIYCKCCRSSNKNWKKEEERITQKRLERQVKADERKAQRKEKTDAIRMKYGLLKSDDEEPLV